ncbi:MAG TPA: response regulator transcription factor [Caldilineaceae bacterium]|nr:response regulator transcription factor [Caldilineaceae bacterium]
METSPSNPIRLLICAPDLLTRVGLAALLQEYVDLTVVGQVAPHADLAKEVDLYHAEVIVWDLGWATAEALDLLGAVVDDCPPILVLAASADDGLPVWTAGARGVLLRNSAPSALVAAVRALIHGLTVIDSTLFPTPPATTPAVLAEAPVESLTPREEQVLQALAQGLSNKLIARRLAISEHTVKFHINAILGKLGAQSRTDAVVRATRAGLIQL